MFTTTNRGSPRYEGPSGAKRAAIRIQRRDWTASPVLIVRGVSSSWKSDDVQEEEDEDDGENEGDASAAVVADSGAHAIAAAAEDEDEDDEKDEHRRLRSGRRLKPSMRVDQMRSFTSGFADRSVSNSVHDFEQQYVEAYQEENIHR